MLFGRKDVFMQNYINEKCPICGKEFTQSDDIVVCPDCGTPHHRECYKQLGHCANEEKHGSFEWSESLSAAVPNTAAPQDIPDSEEETVCPYCGTKNPPAGRYCANCGAPLIKAEERPSPEAFMRERQKAFENIFAEEDFDGVGPKEAALYVKTGIEYFLVRFAMFTKGRKFDTNFSAFIFSYFYLFYRKMYALGAAVLAATLILSVPDMLINLQAVQEYYVQTGLLSQVIWEVPHQDTLAIYALVASVLIWAIRIGLFLFTNKLYYQKVVSSVKEIKSSLTDGEGMINEAEYINSLRKKGGTSMVLPIVLIAISLIASFALAAWIVASPFFIMPTV